MQNSAEERLPDTLLFNLLQVNEEQGASQMQISTSLGDAHPKKKRVRKTEVAMLELLACATDF